MNKDKQLVLNLLKQKIKINISITNINKNITNIIYNYIQSDIKNIDRDIDIIKNYNKIKCNNPKNFPLPLAIGENIFISSNDYESIFKLKYGDNIYKLYYGNIKNMRIFN